MISRLFMVAVMSGCLAAPAKSQEAGALSLEIAGDTYSFPLWASQSDWSGSESYGSVNIYARPTDDETWEKFKTFTLGFEIVNGTASNPEASLMRIVSGDQQKLYAGDGEEDGDLNITVEAASVSGDELSLSGSFTTQMGTSENYGRDIDLSSPLPVTGTFDVVLGPVE